MAMKSLICYAGDGTTRPSLPPSPFSLFFCQMLHEQVISSRIFFTLSAAASLSRFFAATLGFQPRYGSWHVIFGFQPAVARYTDASARGCIHGYGFSEASRRLPHADISPAIGFRRRYGWWRRSRLLRRLAPGERRQFSDVRCTV
jgi:hypothetical protein